MIASNTNPHNTYIHISCMHQTEPKGLLLPVKTFLNVANICSFDLIRWKDFPSIIPIWFLFYHPAKYIP